MMNRATLWRGFNSMVLCTQIIVIFMAILHVSLGENNLSKENDLVRQSLGLLNGKHLRIGTIQVSFFLYA